jgi:hypothetical protein
MNLVGEADIEKQPPAAWRGMAPDGRKLDIGASEVSQGLRGTMHSGGSGRRRGSLATAALRA